jgi:hypothetical protein
MKIIVRSVQPEVGQNIEKICKGDNPLGTIAWEGTWPSPDFLGKVLTEKFNDFGCKCQNFFPRHSGNLELKFRSTIYFFIAIFC